MTIRQLLMIYSVLMIVFLVGPIVAVLPLSFSSTGFLSYPIPAFSLRWYEAVFAPTPWMSSLKNSLIVGGGATVLATILGTLAALGVVRHSLPGRSWFLALLISPLIVPVVVSGVGIFFLFAKVGLNATFTGLILAHAVLGAPFVVVTVAATLQNFDINLLKAAYSLGATPARAFFTVTLPIISPGVIAGALFAFVVSLDEVVVALFIGGPAQRTLPRQMFDGIRDNINPSILAVSALLILITLLFMVALTLITRRSARLAGQPVLDKT
jgi:putative spermidine/putrescine transport system permease protein